MALTPKILKTGFRLKNTPSNAGYTDFTNTSTTAQNTWAIPNTTATSLTFAQITEAQTFAGNQTFSAQILAKDGTKTSPSLSFSSDVDTGIFWKSTGSIGFSANDAEIGNYSSAGAWTLGPTGAADGTVHNVYMNSVNEGMFLRNLNTGSDNSAPLSLIKSRAGTTTANILATFYVNGSTTSGSITANGSNQAAFTSFSDRRLKDNIIPLSNELQKICGLNPCSFDYKTGGTQIGFIAQEIETIYPDSVNYIGQETKQMKTVTGWDKTSARLVAAIKELNAKIESIEARIGV